MREYLVKIMKPAKVTRLDDPPLFINKNSLQSRGQRLKSPPDLFTILRPFLLLGKFLGLFPRENLVHVHQPTPKNRWSWGWLFSCVICGMLGGQVGMEGVAMGGKKVAYAADYALAPANLIFYATGFYVYIYFLRKGPKLIKLLTKWTEMKFNFKLTDLHLRRDINLIAGTIMTSAILENACGHLKFFKNVPYAQVFQSSRETTKSTALEVYYYRSSTTWATYVAYSPMIAGYMFVSNKLATYVWNYMDILIAIFARVLYFQFKALYLRGQILLGVSCKLHQDPVQWQLLVQDHETLCDLVVKLEKFLSPLIFLSYAVNIYWFCLQIHSYMTPSKNQWAPLQSLYTVWSFVHLIARILTVSAMTSQIHEWAHKICDVLKKCPKEMYSLEVAKMERRVRGRVIALSGLGCFVVTRPLMVQIVGIVLTFEIVLLQSAQTHQNHS